MTEKTLTPISEQLCAAFILDLPVPTRNLYGLWGSRSTFRRYRNNGLNVKMAEGMGPTVLPSEFKSFLLKQTGHNSGAKASEGIAAGIGLSGHSLNTPAGNRVEPASISVGASPKSKANARRRRVRK